ncbi:hypothetical protein V1525DRAFT_450230 [Lipomyces kononenkoae]|uniref:Uncharacterized protein n=1 Tax=Lipomyces kononenkoae TaxID=34357 RepID=A0ACC3T269_LIPKO
MTFSLSSIPYYSSSPVALVTGGTNGIGKVTVRELARHGFRVYITARDQDRAEKLLEELAVPIADVDSDGTGQVKCDVRILACDFMDLKSVVGVAEEFMAKEPKLDLLVNNAGVMFTPYAESNDGYEMTLQVNYLAPYLLTRLLLRPLLAADAPRVVNLSSLVHMIGYSFNFSDPNLKNGVDLFNKGLRYIQSKLAVVLFTKQFANLHPKILSLAVHPGIITATSLAQYLDTSTDLFGFVKFSWWLSSNLLSLVGGGTSIEDGALTSLYCATDKDLTAEKDNGGYFVPIAKRSAASSKASDPLLSEKLWKWTEEQLLAKGYLKPDMHL